MDEEPSINTDDGAESNKNNGNDSEQNGTLHSQAPDMSIDEEPSKKSRFRSTCKFFLNS